MRSRVLAAVLAALVAGIGLAQPSPNSAAAQTPVSGLSLWIGIDGVPNCDTQSGDASCNLTPGSTFLVAAHLDPLPTSVTSYGGYDIDLTYTGVTANQDASTDAWPDCSFPASSYDTPGEVQFACAVGLPPATGSTYSGVIGTTSFTCTQSGGVTLVHAAGKTDVIEFDNISKIDGEASGTTDKLTINCVQGGAVPPTPAPVAGQTGSPQQQGTPLAPTEAAKATSTAQSQATATAKAVATAAKQTPGPAGNSTSGGGGLAGWLIAVIIVGGVAAAGAAGVVGWRVMQSRGGGGTPPA